jgi:DNA repair protein RecO (recombination protein O)
LRDHEPHQELFDLLRDYLQTLNQNAAEPTSLIAFELQALAQAGLMPRLGECSVCSGSLPTRAFFDPHHGGAVCGDCARNEIGSISVSGFLLDALCQLQKSAPITLTESDRRKARELLNTFISHQLGRRLRSVDFMRQIGVD